MDRKEADHQKEADHRVGHPMALAHYIQSTAVAHAQLIHAHSGRNPNGTFVPAEFLTNKLAPDLLIDASYQRLNSMMSGLNKWRCHPYRRQTQDPAIIWRNGNARILDFAPQSQAPFTLVIPSLINRHYILDLMDENSFLRQLVCEGLHPVVLDWGEPLFGQGPHGLSEHMVDILAPAFGYLEECSKTKPGILGYCMGGTLAVGLAAHLGKRLSKLCLIGTPWDFSQFEGIAKSLKDHILEQGVAQFDLSLTSMGLQFGAIPAHLFQHLFALIAPMQMVQKFSKFDKMEVDSQSATQFVAVEDWLADPVPVPTEAAKNILIDWYIHNQTGNLDWAPFGRDINPAHITSPSLIITGRKDRIVPPLVSNVLADLIPDTQHLEVDMGHVGMIVGRRSYAEVAKPISAFFYR